MYIRLFGVMAGLKTYMNEWMSKFYIYIMDTFI